MKNKNIKPILLIGAISCIFSLIIGVTYTWFVKNMQVEEDEMTLEIDPDSLAAMPIKTYWCELEDDTPSYFSSTGAKITLPTYDSVFTEQNGYCRLFMRVAIYGDAINAGEPLTISVCIKDMFDGKDGSQTNLNYHDYDEETSQFSDDVATYLSNVITLNCGIIPAINDADQALGENPSDESIKEVNNTIYTTAKTYFDDETNKINQKTFLTLGNSGEDVETPTSDVKKGTLEFPITGYANSANDARIVIDSTSETKAYMLYIYFEIAYSEQLIANLLENHGGFSIGSSSEELGQAFEIESDLEKFVFDVRASTTD